MVQVGYGSARKNGQEAKTSKSLYYFWQYLDLLVLIEPDSFEDE